MVSLRAAAVLLTVLAFSTGVASAGSRASADAPGGLRAFLLRADEPPRTEFPRTPAFAWNPFPGAASYEFQLSTSSAFRDNGIVFKCPSAKCSALETPVASPGVSLPWIDGSPHGLYARVRARLKDGTKTEWSDALGFDVVPPASPTPLPSRPGVLRWAPVAGADGYQVWLVDAKKVETVYTNVLDEREFFTFHASSEWIGTVRWRVRALRGDWQSDERVNGVPITRYGPWSPIFRSTNAAQATAPIALGQTISDVVSDGSRSALAHRLMPAFTWTGNQALDGTRAELFRVYVFTDKQCVNRVFTGSLVGSPAYAPRPYGSLALPRASTEAAQARGVYLRDLVSRDSEQAGVAVDGTAIKSSESVKAAAPTTALPLVEGTAGTGGTSTPAPAGTGTVVGSGTGATPPFVTLDAGTDLGAPVSLWDTDWPRGGYYWTVVAVQAQFSGSISATLAGPLAVGGRSVVVSGSAGFVVNDQVQVGTGSNGEILTVASVVGNVVTFTAGALRAHSIGEAIVKLGGDVVYQDLELPQDVCAAGRVGRFGVSSEPTLIAGDDAFASGLTPKGRLASAVRTASFYKAPLVAWVPAVGATLYQVQWSKKASPFQPEAGPSDGEGALVGATSYVLPLTPGTWYYRVRGIDWSLPTGAQAMGWSEVTKIVITKPTFAVVGSGAAKTTARR